MGRVEFDREAVKPEAGIRALWLLYKRGQWGALEDFGLEREQVEPLFKQFEAEHVLSMQPGRHPLTRKQCRALVRRVPGLEEAGKELRLAYYLKFYDEQAQKGVRIEGFSRRSRGRRRSVKRRKSGESGEGVPGEG